MSAHTAEDLLRLGRRHRGEGRIDAAARALMRAVELSPRSVSAALELGAVLEQQGDLDAAILCFERCTDLDRTSFEAQHGLGRTLRERGRRLTALAHYQCATLLKPGSAEVLGELGSLLHELGREDAAVVHLSRALEIEPESSVLLAALGGVWQSKGDYDRALDAYQRALGIAPNSAEVLVQLASAWFEVGEPEAALSACRSAVEAGAAHIARGGLLYTMAFAPRVSPADLHLEALEYDRLHSAPHRPIAATYPNQRDPGRRLRVGYVSPDFRSHCQSLFTTPLFRAHDHERFEIFCYSTTPRPDETTEALKLLARHWRDLADQSDAALIDAIVADRIDLLIDLTMHMSQNRALVFARRPAPIQICWLAYPGTTGNRSIDYRITDRHIDPPGLDDAHYVEESLRLPDTFWCYDPQSDAEVGPLPARTHGHVTFGCLNNFAKANEGALTNFARVLASLPGSKLVLSCPTGKTRERVRALFADWAVDPSRVEFVGRKPRAGYLSLYDRIDVCLDTVPYNGHTTSLDAIWMGVPVVTLVGDTVVGRAGLCLAENLGMPELVAWTPEELVGRALELTADLEKLERLRAALRARLEGSPLMDAERFARNLEALYRDAWTRYCSENA